VNIELIVQDCFFEASQSATPEANSLTNPISTSTWEHWFSQWLETLHPDSPPAPTHELTLRLTDNAEIQALNSQFRHKNQPTDVLTFAALEVNSPQIPPDMQAAELVYLGYFSGNRLSPSPTSGSSLEYRAGLVSNPWVATSFRVGSSGRGKLATNAKPAAGFTPDCQLDVTRIMTLDSVSVHH